MPLFPKKTSPAASPPTSAAKFEARATREKEFKDMKKKREEEKAKRRAKERADGEFRRKEQHKLAAARAAKANARP